MTEYLLWNSCRDAVLGSLVVEALRVAVGVAVKVRGEASTIGDGLPQQTRTLWNGAEAHLHEFIVNPWSSMVNPGLGTSSVTRLGNLFDFGQLFKAFGNKYFAEISHILGQFL